ncbi:MAG: hypothetical protein ACKPKO_58730, partial [Candidatus Fonsibacter sp.]
DAVRINTGCARPAISHNNHSVPWGSSLRFRQILKTSPLLGSPIFMHSIPLDVNIDQAPSPATG